MTTATLEQVQRLVDRLSPLEQIRLLEYLTPRIVRSAGAQFAASTVPEATRDAAWQEFFQVGEMLAASDRPDMPTLTQCVQAMRR